MPKQLKLLAFNGPPGSGKDYATDEACHVIDDLTGWIALPHKLSAPLKRMVPAMMNTTHRELEASKDKSLLSPMGITYRQAQIDVSEKFMKPVYGQDIFGRLAVNEIAMELDKSVYKEYNVCIIISDLGFSYELDKLIDWVGAENTRIVQLYREGHTFLGDSRSYVTIPGVKHYGINNKGTPAFDAEIAAYIRSWIDGKR
jgi:hypothetical protein